MGNYGGVVFILVYLVCVFMLGMFIMIVEFIVGCYLKVSMGCVYKVLVFGIYWKWLGYLGVLVGFFILGYYLVVVGWILEYILEVGMNGFVDKKLEDFVVVFQSFLKDFVCLFIWLVIFLLVIYFVIVKGVKDGIEKFLKVLMFVLFVLIVVLVGCLLLFFNVEKGLEFLLKFDFSKVNGDVFLGVMGQVFFFLSLGMGCFLIYVFYFGKEIKLGNMVLSVGVIDIFVVVLVGLIIFLVVFFVGIQLDVGLLLIFIILFNVFQ